MAFTGILSLFAVKFLLKQMVIPIYLSSILEYFVTPLKHENVFLHFQYSTRRGFGQKRDGKK
jgi:hypothetical protein